MPVLTFRVSVPLSTSARTPLNHDIISGASAIQSVMIWSPSSNMAIDKSGYRLCNHNGTQIVPDVGSHDNFSFGNAEDGWAAFPPTPRQLALNNQVVEGPPYLLRFQFYNTDAAAILVAGYVVVVEPMAKLAESAMIYEFLTAAKPTDEDVSKATKTPLVTETKQVKPIDITGLIKTPSFEVKKK